MARPCKHKEIIYCIVKFVKQIKRNKCALSVRCFSASLLSIFICLQYIKLAVFSLEEILNDISEKNTSMYEYSYKKIYIFPVRPLEKRDRLVEKQSEASETEKFNELFMELYHT